MYLKDFKKATLQFIEEYEPNSSVLTKDNDISSKINAVINNKMFDIMRYKKIEDKEVMEVLENQEIELSDIDSKCYQIKKIKGVEYEPDGKYITFLEDGTASIYYYKYPKTIDDKAEDDKYKFELDDETLEVMKIGVASALLKMDISNRYGQIWEDEYQRLLQTLDSRRTSGIVMIGEGVDV